MENCLCVSNSPCKIPTEVFWFYMPVTSTVRTGINDPCSRTLELPLSVSPGVFFFYFFCLGALCLGMFFAPFSKGGNFGLTIIALGSFIARNHL